jgi:hypothetical protein
MSSPKKAASSSKDGKCDIADKTFLFEGEEKLRGEKK